MVENKLFSKIRMFWSKLCKWNWNCAWTFALPVFISPIAIDFAIETEYCWHCLIDQWLVPKTVCNKLGSWHVLMVFLALLDLVTVFDAILTSTQTREKLQCLYANPMPNNSHKSAVLKKKKKKTTQKGILLTNFGGRYCA